MSVQDQLNRCMPAAAHGKLGDVLADLISGYNALRSDIAGVLTELQTGIVMPATLAIKAGGSAIVKSTSIIVARVDGTAVTKAANTDMSAIAGNVATTKFAAWDFYVSAAGTLTTSAKTADADTGAEALALLPATPDGKVRLGTLLIENNLDAAANFVAATTALDAAGVTATYYDAAVAAIFTDGLTAEAITDLENRAS